MAPLNPSYVLGSEYSFRTGGAFNCPAARAGRRPRPGGEKVTFLSIRVRSVTRAVGTASMGPVTRQQVLCVGVSSSPLLSCKSSATCGSEPRSHLVSVTALLPEPELDPALFPFDVSPRVRQRSSAVLHQGRAGPGEPGRNRRVPACRSTTGDAMIYGTKSGFFRG